MTGLWGLRTPLAAVLVLVLVAAAPAAAGFRTGLGGPEYRSPDPTTRSLWFDRTVDAGASVVRINIWWRGMTTGRPANAANPADRAYDFTATDLAVRDAVAHGIRPLLTITGAPDYAEGPNRPESAEPGSWQPVAGEVAAFGQAVATRYSGGFNGLPHVRYFQLWNEPNLDTYLTPVWSGKLPAAPLHYRTMLNAFYGAVKGVSKSNVVITGGTAPYGESKGGERVRPLTFWREVLCLRRKRGGGLRDRECPVKPRFDVLAHHPINTVGDPATSAENRDDVSTADLGELRSTLRAAERAHNIAGGRKRHQLWATEIWWETNPPDTFSGISPKKQARYIEKSLYLLWKAGAKVVVNLLIHDAPYDPEHSFASVDAGLFFADGEAKPSYQAFRFPFVTERATKSTVRAWGKSPASGRLVIERQRGDGWRRLSSVRVGAGQVFTATLGVTGKAVLRARIGAETSLAWSQAG